MIEKRPIIFEVQPEYRLYYDDRGDPISYTVGYYNEDEKGPEGNYIIIDQFEFLCKRYDVKVIEGKIVSLNSMTLIPKLVQAKGTKCAREDIAIVIDDDYEDYIEWELTYKNE